MVGGALMPSYMGGKHRLAKCLVGAVALEVGRVDCWVEPFVGGGSVAAAAARRFGCDLVLSDIDPHAAVLWDRSTEFVWPDDAVFTEDDWTRLRDAGAVDKLTALAAFGASFGGKKWGGFARPDLRLRRPCMFGMAVRSWRRKFDAMSAASLVTSECLPYWRVDPPAGSVVYCDPPYAGTTGYASGEFDYDRFYAWCEAQTVPVFVSEFAAPARWRGVFEKEQTRSIRSGDSSKMPEKLFRVVS